MAASACVLQADLAIAESPVETNASDQIVPDIFGNTIVWEDYRDEGTAGADLWMFDLASMMSSPLVQADSDQWEPSIFGGNVVFMDSRDPLTGGPVAFDIWQTNLSGSASPITQTVQDEAMPHINGSRVVFERDNGNGNWNILSALLPGAPATIAGTTSPEQYAVTAGNYTIYSKLVSHQYDLYGYNHATGTSFPIATAAGDQWVASTDGRKVVWEDWRNATTAPDIYTYDLATGVASPLCADSGGQYDPVISGPYVCWWDTSTGKYRIRLHDLNTGITQFVTTAASVARFPNVHERTVVWQDRRAGNEDIYMARVGPDPQAYSSIGLAKLQPNDSGVTLEGRVVTRILSGMFGVSDPDRASGILVKGEHPVALGDRVTVSGVLSSLPAGDRIINPVTVTVGSSGSQLAPLCVANNKLAGKPWGDYTAGAAGSIDLNNTGLLMTVWGKVTSSGSGWFYVDDGSALQAASGQGVRIECGSITSPPMGTMVAVTGISGLYLDSQPSPLLRVALASDIIELAAP